MVTENQTDDRDIGREVRSLRGYAQQKRGGRRKEWTKRR